MAYAADGDDARQTTPSVRRSARDDRRRSRRTRPRRRRAARLRVAHLDARHAGVRGGASHDPADGRSERKRKRRFRRDERRCIFRRRTETERVRRKKSRVGGRRIRGGARRRLRRRAAPGALPARPPRGPALVQAPAHEAGRARAVRGGRLRHASAPTESRRGHGDAPHRTPAGRRAVGARRAGGFPNGGRGREERKPAPRRDSTRRLSSGLARPRRARRLSERLVLAIQRRALDATPRRDASVPPEAPRLDRPSRGGGVAAAGAAARSLRGHRREPARLGGGGGVWSERGFDHASAAHPGRLRGRTGSYLRARAERGRRRRDGSALAPGRARRKRARRAFVAFAEDARVAGPEPFGVERRDVFPERLREHRAHRPGLEGGKTRCRGTVRPGVQRGVPLHGSALVRLGGTPRVVRPARRVSAGRERGAARFKDSISRRVQRRDERFVGAVPRSVRGVRGDIRVRLFDQVRRHVVSLPAAFGGGGEKVRDQSRGVRGGDGARIVRRVQKTRRARFALPEERRQDWRLRDARRGQRFASRRDATRVIRRREPSSRPAPAVRSARPRVRTRDRPEASRGVVGRERRRDASRVHREAPRRGGRLVALFDRLDGPGHPGRERRRDAEVAAELRAGGRRREGDGHLGDGRGEGLGALGGRGGARSASGKRRRLHRRRRLRRETNGKKQKPRRRRPSVLLPAPPRAHGPARARARAVRALEQPPRRVARRRRLRRRARTGRVERDGT